jgi:hypothetical protein
MASMGSGLMKAKDGKLPGYFMGLVGGLAVGVLGAGVSALTNGIMEDKAKRELEEAKSIIRRINPFNLNQANTTAMQHEFLSENGDTKNQILRAKCGKLPKFSNGVEGINGPTNRQ